MKAAAAEQVAEAKAAAAEQIAEAEPAAEEALRLLSDSEAADRSIVNHLF